MASYRGIDVSNWSGYINWRDVREAGIEVAIIQASEGTFYRDPYLHEFYNGAKENGIKVTNIIIGIITIFVEYIQYIK